HHGFKIPVDLEALYRSVIWDWAKEKDHLKLRNRREVYPSLLIEKILGGEVELDAGLDDEWCIYVQHRFKSDSKTLTARHLAAKDDAECRIELSYFEPLLNDVLMYLGFAAPG
ncbi:MAG: hypothetical protein Q9M33_04095, partial [Robiginitomaculum sp.]|nr:hypothetical protein [Robiginitomaculum sp.]